jgi:hypothetical protein
VLSNDSLEGELEEQVEHFTRDQRSFLRTDPIATSEICKCQIVSSKMYECGRHLAMLRYS